MVERRGAAPANAALGDVAVTLAGKDYVLRPTFEAVMAIEGATGVGFPELYTRFRASRYTTGEVVIVLREGMRAYDKVVRRDAEIGRIIRKTGLMVAALAASKYLGAWLTGPAVKKPAAKGASENPREPDGSDQTDTRSGP